MPGETSRVPLRRNRDFVLFELGRLFSSIGTQLTVIAYPLLTLAVTQSPAKAGVVGFARMLPQAVFGLLAGVAADRWNRKRIMLAADALRALAVASLAALIVLDRVAFWQIVAVVLVEAVGSTFFHTAAGGAVRGIVPAPQLPAAMSVGQARGAVVNLLGPTLGGALYGAGRAVPFVGDAISYAFSLLSLIAIKKPFQEERERDRARLRTQMADGFRFLWGHPFLRTCAFFWAVGNFAIPGILLVIVVAGTREGLSSTRIGVLFAVFGGFVLLGSLLSPLYRRALSMGRIVQLEQWSWAGCLAAVVWPNPYVLTAALLPLALALPVSDAVVDGYRVAVTPDRLLGRVESARSTISLAIAPFGPLLAGLLLSTVSVRATIAFFVACGLALAVWATFSPSIRAAPSLETLVERTVHGAE